MFIGKRAIFPNGIAKLPRLKISALTSTLLLYPGCLMNDCLSIKTHFVWKNYQTKRLHEIDHFVGILYTSPLR